MKGRPNCKADLVKKSIRVGENTGAFIAFVGLTGCRPIEAMRIRFCDLSLDDDAPMVELLAKNTKTKRERYVPLVPELVDILREERKNRSIYEGKPIADNALIWTSTDVKRLVNFKGYASRIGIVQKEGFKLSPYSLRHSCAIALRKNGVRDDVICSILGTSQEMLNFIYASCDFADKASAMATLIAPRKGTSRTQAETGSNSQVS